MWPADARLRTCSPSQKCKMPDKPYLSIPTFRNRYACSALHNNHGDFVATLHPLVFSKQWASQGLWFTCWFNMSFKRAVVPPLTNKSLVHCLSLVWWEVCCGIVSYTPHHCGYVKSSGQGSCHECHALTAVQIVATKAQVWHQSLLVEYKKMNPEKKRERSNLVCGLPEWVKDHFLSFMCYTKQTEEKHLEGQSVLKPAFGKYLHENCKSKIVKFWESLHLCTLPHVFLSLTW